jgi:serine/threonine-protein kinase
METVMTSEVMSEPEGQRFGQYVLTAELGRGGMGVVYRAYDTAKGRTVALKVLIPELAADRLFRDRFRRESRRAARLSEPHIIPIHNFGEIDGRLFIDMRLVEGIDLAALLDRDGPLPPTAAAWIIAQVASALDAAHAGGLIHRDVKPSNILVTGHGQSMPFAYLIDFGIARAVDSTSLATNTGTIGTLAYMAPERIGGAPGDGRVDVYSLACVLYECLTGRQPFTGEMVAVMWAQVNAAPPAASAVRPGLPTAVDAVVARGMAKDPADRYGTAGELAAAVLAAAADPGPASPAPAAGQPPAAPSVQTAAPVKSAGRRTGPAAPLWEGDSQGVARAALRAVVSDPSYGVAALSSSQTMSILLKDLLPDMQREAMVLVAAAEAGLADTLRSNLARGADLATARAQAVTFFAARTGFRPAACRWAVDELTAALGLDSAGTWTTG